MGQVKAMAMDLEEEFFEMCAILVGECGSFGQYREKMSEHFDMVKHMDLQDIEYTISEIWNDYWSEYV